MFEKDAKERAEKLEEKQTLGVYDNDEDLARDEGFNDGEVCGYEKGFQEGAEFGYNKANEWQYVSEKGTPKTEGHYLVCLRNKDKDILDCWILYDKDVGWYSMQIRMKDIYAWKEIMPPELPKEIAE